VPRLGCLDSDVSRVRHAGLALGVAKGKQTTMHDFRFRRRSFLAGAGTTALATMLRPIMAYAQAGITPQRLLLIHRPCGTALGSSNTMYPNDTRWWPTGGTTGWTASPLLSSF